MIFFNNLFKKKFSCDICQIKFKKIEELMQHEQINHQNNKSYDCYRCDQTFDGMEQMRDHIKKFHSYNKMKGKL